MLAAPRGFEPRFTDPKSAVLPLDEGAAVRERRNWSGRRDSNPRPSPWQGDALPTEPLPLEKIRPPVGGAESQDRTGDTAIFSRVLYQLSYLGPMANQAVGCPSAGGTIPRASKDHSSERQRSSRRAHASRRSSPSPADLPYSSPTRLAASVACSGASPVSSRSRLIRSRMAGWVEVRPDARASNFLIGFVKYMCCVPRLATSSTSCPSRSWPAPARGRRGCGSVRSPTRRPGIRAGG